MAHALDRLGWLQFQQLCTRLLELETGLEPAAWSGEADQWRFARSEVSLAAPLLRYELPGPVLVHCAWVAPGTTGGVANAVEMLSAQLGHRLREVRSYLLLSNGELDAPLHAPAGDEELHVGVMGAAELGARIDALPALRLAMPSLLGLRDLGALIPDEVGGRSTLQRAAAEELAGVFVPTQPYQRALEVLADHRFTVLTGPPEMGKTATARTIALAKMTDGWQAHECTTPDEVADAWDPAAAQVFIADDAFGSTEYRAEAAERWAAAMERLLRSLDDRHWLIWTSRPAPLHAALRRLHRERGAERFPAPARVLVDAGHLHVTEKTLILLRHAKSADLPAGIRRELRREGVDIVSDPHFTPERIRRLVGALQAGETDVARAAAHQLATATEAMATSLGALGPEHRDLLVALLDTPPGPVPERELSAALRRHHEGSLSHPPAELVDRLTDHFLRVTA